MSDEQLLTGVRTIMSRTGLTPSQVAVLAGVSPSTMRTMLVAGLVPMRRAPRESLSRFLDANKNTTSRSEVIVP